MVLIGTVCTHGSVREMRQMRQGMTCMNPSKTSQPGPKKSSAGTWFRQTLLVNVVGTCWKWCSSLGNWLKSALSFWYIIPNMYYQNSWTVSKTPGHQLQGCTKSGAKLLLYPRKFWTESHDQPPTRPRIYENLVNASLQTVLHIEEKNMKKDQIRDIYHAP